MHRHVRRSVALAVAVGTVLTVALASPASAEDVIPSGCVGSLVYACTGEGDPPEEDRFTGTVVQIPITIETPPVDVPALTVGGQETGWVVVVGGQTIPETVVGSVGGPVGPIDTGVVVPIAVCVFVTCVPAGTHIVVPGIDLPVVPVVIPETTLPSETVVVPSVGTVPSMTVGGYSVPESDLDVTTLSVYADPIFVAVPGFVCREGGGDSQWYDVDGRRRYECSGGNAYTTAVANLLYSALGFS